jgi:hypothetical protein
MDQRLMRDLGADTNWELATTVKSKACCALLSQKLATLTAPTLRSGQIPSDEKQSRTPILAPRVALA